MHTKDTCLVCGLEGTKCKVSSECPDDETTTTKRKQVFAEWPQI